MGESKSKFNYKVNRSAFYVLFQIKYTEVLTLCCNAVAVMQDCLKSFQVERQVKEWYLTVLLKYKFKPKAKAKSKAKARKAEIKSTRLLI